MVILIYPVYRIIPLSWYQEWIQKSDSILSLYPSIQGKYSLLDESLPYYMGLLDLSIYCVKDYSYLVGNVKEKEFAETIKSLFWSSYRKYDIREVIQSNKYYCYDLVIARLLYPNYFFQLFDDIVKNKKDSSCLDSVIQRADEYEQFLKIIIEEVRSFYPLKKYPIL